MMRVLAGGLAALALACVGGVPLLPGPGEGPPALVVIVSVGGLTADRYLGSAGRPADMPVLAALARAGAAADRTTSVAPATVYPAHATLLTGRPPAAHGVVADLRLGDRGVRPTPYWHASHLRAPPLWQVAGEARLLVASIAWPSTVGAAIPLLLPDIVPLRSEQRWIDELRDATTPRLLELAAHHGGDRPEVDRAGAARDRVLTGVACDLLSSAAPPRLLLLRLAGAEPALGRDGAAAATPAFSEVDAQIRRLIGSLHGAGLLEQTALVVVGDAGVLPIHTAVSPNIALAQAGLIQLAGGGIDSWSAVSRSNGGSSFVYARTDQAALKARALLAREAARTGAFRIVSAEEMLAFDADPEAWFGLQAEPGFAFDNGVDGALLRPAAWRAVAGHLPDRGVDTGFVAWGRGVREGLRIPEMHLTDVAPTVAALLGLEMGDVEGRALVGALQRVVTPAVAADRVGGEPRER